MKVGVNSPSYNYGDSRALSEAEFIRSFNLAGYLDAFIGQGIYLHPEVSLQGKGTKIVKYAELGGGEVIQRVNWLDFAFNLLSKMPVGNVGEFFGGGGPYMGFAMNGENKYPDGSTSAVIIYKENTIKSIDYGISFLTGIKLGSRVSLSANYSIGLANITYVVNKWSKNIKNRVFSLSIGVSFVGTD